MINVGVIGQSCNTTCPEGYFNNVTTCACTECVIPQCQSCTSQYYCKTSGLVDQSNSLVCTKEKRAIELSTGFKSGQIGGSYTNEQCKSAEATFFPGTKCVSQSEKDYLDSLLANLIYLVGIYLAF
ncbi:hypothetical protein pb186bvf_004364 [Paramecium bursaria]